MTRTRHNQLETDVTALEVRLRAKYTAELRSRTCEHFDGHTAARLIEGLPLEQPVPAHDRPVIVCLCGSTRFWHELAEANLRETAAGRIVPAPGCDMKTPHPLWADPGQADELKKRLDVLHRAKVDAADEVLVVNPGGYVGDSTRAEIAYAHTLGKPVRYTYETGPQE